MRALTLLLVLLLAGCHTCPPPRLSLVPGPVEYRDRLVVQPVDPSLLRLHPVAEGPPSQCIEIAAERRMQLEACNEDKAAIRSQREHRED